MGLFAALLKVKTFKRQALFDDDCYSDEEKIYNIVKVCNVE